MAPRKKLGMESEGIGRRVLAGRFELVECIKGRSGVETWRGTDLFGGSPVIVKLVPTRGMTSATRFRLEHEALVLSELELAARPVAVGGDGSAMYLAQSFVEGVNLEELLRDGALPVATAVQIGIGMLRDLCVAHDRGVVHRDVKPANIMVTGAASEIQAALIDFGLASSSWLAPSLRAATVGTARYLAPEAAGLIQAPVDERSDLYSAGVVLYECLTGQPPFAGDSVGELLQAHARQQPAPLRSARRAVPASLDAIVARLLAKDPAERYQSAAAAGADLRQLAAALSSGVADPPMTIGMSDRRTRLSEPGFVGRRGELAALLDAIVAPGEPRRLLLLEAESGTGKSRLLDELCLAVDPATVVLRGQGADRVARRPFQILEGVVAAIAELCRSDASLAGFLAARLGSLTDVAVQALPDLAGLLSWSGATPATDGADPYGEARTVNALCVLLDALAERSQSVVVLLDDAQWSDASTLELLREWPGWSRSVAGNGHLVMVAAFRSEEIPAGHPLRDLPAALHVTLKGLDAADIVALCESMAGPTAAEVTDVVSNLSEGSPFMAAAIMRGLVEGELIHHRPSGWAFASGAGGIAQTSLRAALVLGERLRLLSPDARTLLGAGAVLGKRFDLDRALGLAGLDPGRAAPALEEARRRQVVWVDERDGTCAFTHDKLRERLLEDLDSPSRHDLHRRAAENLDSSDPEAGFDLAYHLDAAGLVDRAFPHAMAAAAAARRRHALDVAVAQYRIAERGAPAAAVPERCSMHSGLGEVLALTGDYDGAESHLQSALELTSDPLERSRLEGRLGDVAFRRGDQLAARRYVEGALRQLGRRVPRRGWAFMGAALWEVLVQTVHSLAPSCCRRRPLEGAERDLLAARLYSRLAYVYWFSAGRFPCAWSHLRGMNLAERYHPSAELAQAWSEHAPVMTMIPWFGRGVAYARRSYDLRVALGDEWGQGQSLSFHGVVLYGASRFEECIGVCRQAVELLARMGDRWEENTARWHIAFCQYRLGDLDAAVDTARQVHARAGAIGDGTSRGIALSVWARAAAGDVDAGLIAEELGRGVGDAHTAVEVRLAEAVRLLRLDRPAAAASVLGQARKIVDSAGLRQEYVAPVYAWMATAERSVAAALPALAGRARRRALGAARRAARRAVVEGWFYRNNRPHALREAALVAAMSGRDRRAARLLARATRVGLAQGAAHEVDLCEQARRDLAAPAEPGGGATAGLPAPPLAANMDDAASAPAVYDRWNLSLADRFSTLLDASRHISSASSPAEVYVALRDAGDKLLRAEHCHIVAVPADADLAEVAFTESGNPIATMSVKLVEEALRVGGPVVAGDGLGGDSSESLVLSDARSTLCCPVYADGRAVAVLYAMTRQLAHLFGEQEARMASLITSLAGAALEHVAGSEARFRSLVRNSSDAISIIDGTGRISYQSESALRVFGARPEAMVGTVLTEWVHPDDTGLLPWPSSPDRSGPERPGTSTTELRAGSPGTGWRHVEMAVADLRADPGVGAFVVNTRDISERVALEDELRHRASHDVVTGLANRAAFVERVDEALSRYRSRAEPFAVMFVDLDDFKAINDTLGHATGDQVLRVVAGRLASCVGPEDTVARFGGDEFAVLLRAAGAERAEAVGVAILSALGEAMDLRGHRMESLASIGMATADGGDSSEAIMAAADAALYVAKARGKHRFEMFEPSMRAAVMARAALRTELERAVESGEMRVFYQPIVDLGAGEVAGFEALVRWARPQGVLLGPDQFIPLAEESGSIVGIGAWVLVQACHQAAQWRALTGRPLTMAVNVSARQLLHPSFLDQVRSALDGAALEASALTLEITESATVRDTAVVISKLDELKAAGVSLAIDDFGTGYSALSYLHRLPVDVIKIDRSFVSGLGRNTQDGAIVAAIVGLAGALGLTTVAEGVEALEQLEVVAALGCSHAQGYNWSRPEPAEAISRWLADGSPSPDHRPARVLVVDDSAGLRAALAAAIGIDGRLEVVGEAADGDTALELAGRLAPDVVLLDLMMPGSGGLEILPRLRQVSPASEVVILSAREPAEVPAPAILAARALLDKTRDLTSVIEQLVALGAGRS